MYECGIQWTFNKTIVGLLKQPKFHEQWKKSRNHWCPYYGIDRSELEWVHRTSFTLRQRLECNDFGIYSLDGFLETALKLALPSRIVVDLAGLEPIKLSYFDSLTATGDRSRSDPEDITRNEYDKAEAEKVRGRGGGGVDFARKAPRIDDDNEGEGEEGDDGYDENKIGTMNPR
jgi:hypothetical protein